MWIDQYKNLKSKKSFSLTSKLMAACSVIFIGHTIFLAHLYFEHNQIINTLNTIDFNIIPSNKAVIVQDAIKKAQHGQRTHIFFFIFGTITLPSLGFYLYKTLIQPTRNIAESMVRLSLGVPDTELKESKRTDEIGYMAEALTSFKDSAFKEVTAAEKAYQQEMRHTNEREKYIDSVLNEFDKNIRMLIENVINSTAQTIQETTKQLTNITKTNSKQTSALSKASKTSINHAQTMSKSAQGLLEQINDVNRQIVDVAPLIKNALNNTEEAERSVSELETRVETILSIVELVKKIANQINMLALNATIEAARAGEAGKGFAVVAAEVNALAQDVHKAADDISDYTGSIQESSAQTAQVIHAMNDVTRNIRDVFKTIEENTQSQAQTTTQISNVITQTYESTQEVANISAIVSDTSNTSEEIVEKMRSITGDIGQQSTMLEMYLTRFIAVIHNDDDADGQNDEDEEEDIFF